MSQAIISILSSIFAKLIACLTVVVMVWALKALWNAVGHGLGHPEATWAEVIAVYAFTCIMDALDRVIRATNEGQT